MDPVSAIAGAVGQIGNAVGNIVSSKNNLKATIEQRYIAGEITQQEYIKLKAQEENNISDTVNNLLTAQNKTNYLPYLLIGGIILVVVVAIVKKAK
ncbi:MAG: hypothetical protein WCR20_23770 [Verrucomicrobiota bacterium]